MKTHWYTSCTHFQIGDATASYKSDVNCETCIDNLRHKEMYGSVDDRMESDVAVEHGVQRTEEACLADRHDYYRAFLDYVFCPYCGERLPSR